MTCKCYNCGKQIKFRIDNDKYIPTNKDGSDHKYTCNGKRKPARNKLRTEDYGRIIGKNYIPYTGDDSIPPWEIDESSMCNELQHFASI